MKKKSLGMLYINTSDKINQYTKKPIKYISGEINGTKVYGFINVSKKPNKDTGEPVVYVELFEQEELKGSKKTSKKKIEDFDF